MSVSDLVLLLELEMAIVSPQLRVLSHAEYIFRKQIEEADFVILNRIDELASGEIENLTRLLSERYSTIPVIRMSAKTESVFEALCEFLDQQRVWSTRHGS